MARSQWARSVGLDGTAPVWSYQLVMGSNPVQAWMFNIQASHLFILSLFRNSISTKTCILWFVPLNLSPVFSLESLFVEKVQFKPLNTFTEDMSKLYIQHRTTVKKLSRNAPSCLCAIREGERWESLKPALFVFHCSSNFIQAKSCLNYNHPVSGYGQNDRDHQAAHALYV